MIIVFPATRVKRRATRGILIAPGRTRPFDENGDPAVESMTAGADPKTNPGGYRHALEQETSRPCSLRRFSFHRPAAPPR